jgi:hypothetical protein
MRGILFRINVNNYINSTVTWPATWQVKPPDGANLKHHNVRDFILKKNLIHENQVYYLEEL